MWRRLKQPTETGKEFEETIRQVVNRASQTANVSLVVTNETLLRAIETKMEKEINWNTMELFNVWNIKGLERKSVILIGSYLAEEKDVDSAKLFKIKDLNHPDDQSYVTHYNRLMLVAQSRAEERMLVLHTKPGLKRIFTRQYRQLKYPSISPINDKYSNLDLNGKLDLLFSGLQGSQVFSVMLKEALELSEMARFNPSQLGIYQQSKTRIKNNEGIIKDSTLSKKHENILSFTKELIDDLLCIEYREYHFNSLKKKLATNDIYSQILNTHLEYRTLTPVGKRRL